MAKKPKAAWQIAVRAELEKRGIGYKELAEATGDTEPCIRQAMSKDNQPLLRRRICEYLNVSDD